jgi:hypothetical protein
MPNVIAYRCRGSTPYNLAATRFCAVARIARPRRVFSRNDGRSKGHQAHLGNDHSAQCDVAASIARIDGAKVRGKRELCEVCDDDLKSEGNQQRVEHRRTHDQVQQPALDNIAENEHGHGDDRKPEERIDTEAGEQVPGEIAAQHDEGAVRQIHDVQHTPD